MDIFTSISENGNRISLAAETATVVDMATAVAMGVFDGVHLGHRAVLQAVTDYCSRSALQLKPTVFTFVTDSAKPDKKAGFKDIIPASVRFKLFEQMGIELLLAPPFEQIRHISPERFLKEILCGCLKAKAVVCGTDFRFGENAAGNVKLLKSFCEEYGMEAIIIPPLARDGVKISSSLIRDCISNGNIVSANELLGYNYFVESQVLQGAKLGRAIGIPTINQRLCSSCVLPKFGVYSSQVRIDGVLYKAVTNVGVKPTVEADNSLPAAETHIIGFDGDLYGHNVKVELLEFIRPEIRFNSIDELKTAIEKDINSRLLSNLVK